MIEKVITPKDVKEAPICICDGENKGAAKFKGDFPEIIFFAPKE